MTESTAAKIPAHLKKYVVDQNYVRYTEEDQATWRYVMRQLRQYLTVHAHPTYLDGLARTGIGPDRIPRIADVDAHLEKFGWGAVPVSGFIPPAAFMEFQSIGVLPVASDMRTLEHWLYTPAPDIVHEAAGHAPLLIHPDYSAYLRRYGEVARHTIISRDDLDQYEAIRVLSDLKEDPHAAPADIAVATAALNAVNARTVDLSEAALLSRMNWWTAEYGLIGSLEQPKLFGAGLLSSVGEARTCLGEEVKKIPLTVDCVTYGYDITEPQPHLFVTPDFATLTTVLDQVADRLSYRRGGIYGLDQAVKARTVNTVVLDSGVQISGTLTSYLTDDAGEPAYLRFDGPAQLSRAYQEFEGQGPARHAHGYSCPVGRLDDGRNLADLSAAELTATKGRLNYQSGVRVEGTIRRAEYVDQRLQYLTLTDCTVTRGAERLFEPAWGEYDLAAGARVTSVFGGPADRGRFGDDDTFVNKRVPARRYSPAEMERFALYRDVDALRTDESRDYDSVLARYLAAPGDEWLIGLELLEVAVRRGRDQTELRARLNPSTRATSTTRLALTLGLAVIDA